jgi:hypothetical protein
MTEAFPQCTAIGPSPVGGGGAAGDIENIPLKSCENNLLINGKMQHFPSWDVDSICTEIELRKTFQYVPFLIQPACFKTSQSTLLETSNKAPVLCILWAGALLVYGKLKVVIEQKNQGSIAVAMRW